MGRGRHELHEPRPWRGAMAATLWVGAVSAALVAVALWLTGGEDTVTQPPQTGTPGSSSTSAPQGQVTATPTQPEGASAPAAPESSSASTPASGSATTAPPTTTAMAMPPTVALRLVGTSWIEVRGPDGRVLVSEVCGKGDHASFRHRVVQVTVGNAGAVRMRANGEPVELGGQGEVRQLTVRRGGD